MASQAPRDDGTPTASCGTSVPGRSPGDTPPARRTRRRTVPVLVVLAAVLGVGPAVTATATEVSAVVTEVGPPAPAPADDAAARATRLAALEAAVVAAQTAAADVAAAEELIPVRAPVRVPDGDLRFTSVATPGGATVRLRDDAPRGVLALVDTWPNGAIPAAALCPVPFALGLLLQCDAAEALADLDAAYHERFGSHLAVNSGYRSFGTQVGLRSTKGRLAAVPGSSNHGWGLAIDIGGIGGLGEFDAPGYLWLQENAERFGWHHPRAMEPGGSGPQEPWHWEFATARS